MLIKIINYLINKSTVNARNQISTGRADYILEDYFNNFLYILLKKKNYLHLDCFCFSISISCSCLCQTSGRFACTAARVESIAAGTMSAFSKTMELSEPTSRVPSSITPVRDTQK